ncbi:MAG TPA: J domain-containing protein [Terriglobales bacterium]
MSVCACGRDTNEGQSMCDRCTALTTFGLTRDATQAEIKDAYRTLAKVWHPDRFQGDEHLRAKAEEKLKGINSAYHLLTTTAAAGRYSKPSSPASRPQESQQAAAAAPGWIPYQPLRESRFRPSFQTRRYATRRGLAVVVAMLVIGGVWIYVRHNGLPSFVVDDAPRQAVGQDATSTGAAGQSSKKKKQSQHQATDSAKPGEEAGAHVRPNPVASLVVYPDEDPQVAYFTVGSTKSDVVRIQGTPSSIAGDVLRYGESEVTFQYGRVQSWHEDPGSPLKARLPQ